VESANSRYLKINQREKNISSEVSTRSKRG
jgi:hypothetical protein